MKRQAIMLLTTFSLLVMLTATTVNGQSDMRLKANIPFEFSIGKTMLPAGEYTISYSAQGFLIIQSEDRRVSQAFMTLSTQANTARDKSSLVFNQYGDQYFLSTIWTAGDYIGQVLRKPQAERELIRASHVSAKSSWARQSVSIVAHR
jgi:hypothetical protein